MKIVITKELLSVCPSFDVLAYEMDVTLKDRPDLKKAIDEKVKEIEGEYSISDVLSIPLIKEARDAYKSLGKDPSRYRLAVESLYRRIVKGNGLYYVNNLVDAGNLLSLECMRSTAILDRDEIIGDVRIRIGRESDDYEGIGRGKIDVSNIPVYEDDISPFGSTTSDTMRTMIKETTNRICVFIICFSHTFYEENKEYALHLFTDYCDAKNIREVEVIKEH